MILNTIFGELWSHEPVRSARKPRKRGKARRNPSIAPEDHRLVELQQRIAAILYQTGALEKTTRFHKTGAGDLKVTGLGPAWEEELFGGGKKPTVRTIQALARRYQMDVNLDVPDGFIVYEPFEE